MRLTNERTANGGSSTGTATIDEVYIQRTPAPPPAVAPAIVGSNTFGDGVTLLHEHPVRARPVLLDGWRDVRRAGLRDRRVHAHRDQSRPHGNGTAMSPSADPNCKTGIAGATAWTSPFFAVNPLSGQQQFTLAWTEHYTGGGLAGCNGGGNCAGSFGVQQQTYGACNGNAGANTCADPDDSGPIVLAQVGEGLSRDDRLVQGRRRTHNLLVKVEVQGLNADKPGDGSRPRCCASPRTATIRRV